MPHYEIESGIPPPEKPAPPLKALLSRMLVGDSFTAPMKKKNIIYNYIQRINRDQRKKGEVLEFRYTIHQIDQENIRVWRIA